MQEKSKFLWLAKKSRVKLFSPSINRRGDSAVTKDRFIIGCMVTGQAKAVCEEAQRHLVKLCDGSVSFPKLFHKEERLHAPAVPPFCADEQLALQLLAEAKTHTVTNTEEFGTPWVDRLTLKLEGLGGFTLNEGGYAYVFHFQSPWFLSCATELRREIYRNPKISWLNDPAGGFGINPHITFGISNKEGVYRLLAERFYGDTHPSNWPRANGTLSEPLLWKRIGDKYAVIA